MRILYIGYEMIGDKSATGRTLYNLLSSNEVMQVCTDYNTERHLIIYPTVTIDKWLSLMFCICKSAYRSITEKNKHRSNSISKNVSGHNKSLFVATLQAIQDSLPKRLTGSSYQKIKSFKPDIIYTLGENISTLRLSTKLEKMLNKPIVIHAMDDIESSIYTESSLLLRFRHKYLSLLESIYKNNFHHLTISSKMASEYTSRHNVNYGFAMNCIDEIGEPQTTNNKTIKIVFSGGLHGGRDESLKQIESIIDNNPELKSKVVIDIYTSPNNVDYYSNYFSLFSVHEYVPANDMRKNLSSYDILLHVESFEPEEIAYFKYSLSTKIPEYLSIGRPILCYGPLEINTISYIKEQDAGIVATTPDDFKKSLFLLINSEELRHFYSQRAVTTANNNHYVDVIRQRMYDIMSNSIRDYEVKFIR